MSAKLGDLIPVTNIINEFKVPVFEPREIIRSPDRLKPDYKALAAMCSINATLAECAIMEKTTPNVLNRKIKLDFGLSFHEFKEIYKPAFTFMIRQKQLQRLMSEDPRTIQWLAMNYLGQTPTGAKNEDKNESILETKDLLKIVNEKENKLCPKEAKKRKKENESIKPLPDMESLDQNQATSNQSE